MFISSSNCILTRVTYYNRWEIFKESNISKNIPFEKLVYKIIMMVKISLITVESFHIMPPQLQPIDLICSIRIRFKITILALKVETVKTISKLCTKNRNKEAVFLGIMSFFKRSTSLRGISINYHGIIYS